MHRLTASARTAALTAPFVLVGCALRVGPSAPPNAAVQMANPASTYCVQQGGKLSILKDAAGNQSGLCTLPDGTAIDEWALFRRDHPAAESPSTAPEPVVAPQPELVPSRWAAAAESAEELSGRVAASPPWYRRPVPVIVLAALVALVEGIRYLTLKQPEFAQKAARMDGPFAFLW